MKSGTIFDNFLITDDEKFAEEFGNDTWGATKVWGGERHRTRAEFPPRPWGVGGTAMTSPHVPPLGAWP